MGGSGEICQIDEILLRGKRKNNKGRLTIGDKEEKESKEAIKIGDINFDEEEDEDYEDHKNMKNYGKREDGPWIFGISWYRDKEWKKKHQRGLEYKI
jgi:hypothetical protein